MEFHISRQSRDRYQFDEAIYSFNGNVILADFHAARRLAQKINDQRDLLNYPEQTVKAGQINAMGLIDEILHLVIAHYRQRVNPQAMEDARAYLASQVGEERIEFTLERFLTEFPPVAVYQGQQTIEEFLDGVSEEGLPNRSVALEEMLMLWIANKNPALAPFMDLFDDLSLTSESAYFSIMQHLYTFFETQPHFGPRNQNLIAMLRSPAIAAPHSLFAQLEHIRTNWTELLGRYLYRLLSGLDLIKEESKLPFHGPGVIPLPTYSGLDDEPEHFSPDSDWMPNVIMIAKNAYVWLDQLSKKYQRSITRLDQIPDEELDVLARSGFTGLWLIGLWERSSASARIKQLCGNPEAIASAYSLSGYSIAWELGGEEACDNLRQRAWQRGIRLASDMVPNHMGIDSHWVVDHPDWFIGLDHSPFPSYTFNGPDLSPDSRVTIQIEDHYYERSDAAVVFKRIDNHSGHNRYIYHGNDGTSMAWNDTAQLDYLKSEVREAVIQTIFSVARRFPIIRFDAAMTLAKKHFQRLWFPEPGSGGDIPSRAEHSMTRAQFEQLFPVEFWREVVDRVAQEVPNTLLLAEAFWMMEGYFVRTLGMHRVYNSAFMNLLRDEDNAKYRTVMKNTLEFDPEILKRFVNFMNNPDERTAVDQFGKDGKYFGICVLMSTLPGLPMFGHGQIEGFTEKYGMEYRRAYWDEQPDPYLVERHERQIFPLLHRRWLFSGVENFLLYDLFTPDGAVNEDVLVYSNGVGSQRALVVYHNRFGSTSGWVRTSVAYMDKSTRQLVQRSLAEGLAIRPDENTYVIMRDQTADLEYIRPASELCDQGLFLQLDAYTYHVFLDFRHEADDSHGSYSRLCSILAGRGVPSIQEALIELLLQPIHEPFQQIANPGYLSYLLSQRLPNRKPRRAPVPTLPNALFEEVHKKTADLLAGIEYRLDARVNRTTYQAQVAQTLEALLSLPRTPARGAGKNAIHTLIEGLNSSTGNERWLILLGWCFTRSLGLVYSAADIAGRSQTLFDEWRLGPLLTNAYNTLGHDEESANRMAAAVRLLIGFPQEADAEEKRPTLPPDVLQFIQANRYEDVLWFNKEAYEEYAWWTLALALIDTQDTPAASSAHFTRKAAAVWQTYCNMFAAAAQSEYRLDKLLEYQPTQVT
jgi:glycosidase